MMALFVLILVFLILMLLATFSLDYISNQPGEWSTAAIWTPNGVPGLTDGAEPRHKVTITDTEELIERLVINSLGGELEINAVTQDAGLKIRDSSLGRLYTVDSLTVPAVLDLNGTEDYTAYIRSNDPAPSNDLWCDLTGNHYLTYAEISGFHFGHSTETDRIVMPGGLFDMDHSFIGSHPTFPFFFWGKPASWAMNHSYFENMWPAFYYDNTHYFKFNEFLTDIDDYQDVIGIRHGITGRNKSRNHQLGMMGREWELAGVYNKVENRFDLEDLIELINYNYKYTMWLTEEVIQDVLIGPLERFKPRGNPYMKQFMLHVEEADP